MSCSSKNEIIKLDFLPKTDGQDGKKIWIGISVIVYETNNGLEIKKLSVFKPLYKYACWIPSFLS